MRVEKIRDEADLKLTCCKAVEEEPAEAASNAEFLRDVGLGSIVLLNADGIVYMCDL